MVGHRLSSFILKIEEGRVLHHRVDAVIFHVLH